jgi:hypothetical protein
MIAGADKGNSIVVLQRVNYEDKIQDFLKKPQLHLRHQRPHKLLPIQSQRDIKTE